MFQVAILLFVSLVLFKLIAEYRIGRNEDIAARICTHIKPHEKFREFYQNMFVDCQNPDEQALLLELAQSREREFDLRVSRILAEHASRQDLKQWLAYYTRNPGAPFKHASAKFNESTTEIAANLVDDILILARQKLNQKEI